jgi:hypothetical protein
VPAEKLEGEESVVRWGKEKCGACLRNFDHGSLQIENPVIKIQKIFGHTTKTKKMLNIKISTIFVFQVPSDSILKIINISVLVMYF